MRINTKNRTQQSEIMDDFDLEGEELRDALDKIAKINHLLGGNRVTLQGVHELLIDRAISKKITLVDIGCGNGDMLRTVSEYGKKNKINFDLIGIDANNFTINHAKQLSKNYSNIHYRCENIMESSFQSLSYDIVLCTLTLHHFKKEEILYLLKQFYENSTIGIVINDLHRSRLAYRLFQALCFVFHLNKMSRDDGLISILRGFKKKDLVQLSQLSKFSQYSIRWKWAFRYQWIIKK